MIQANFKALCCAYFACPPGKWETEVFHHCLHRHAAIPAGILNSCIPWFFEWDFELIRGVSLTTDLDDLELEVNRFIRRNPPSGFFHEFFSIRVSGQALLALGREVFAEDVANAGTSTHQIG